jgi:hypothetical protein
MQLISYDGFQRKLPETKWKQMKKMFDAGSAVQNIFGYYIVHTKSICADNSHKCLRCPLSDQHKNINSCLQIFTHIVGEDAMQRLLIYDHGILWHPKDDAIVRQALQKVSSVLSSAQEIIN